MRSYTYNSIMIQTVGSMDVQYLCRAQFYCALLGATVLQQLWTDSTVSMYFICLVSKLEGFITISLQMSNTRICSFLGIQFNYPRNCYTSKYALVISSILFILHFERKTIHNLSLLSCHRNGCPLKKLQPNTRVSSQAAGGNAGAQGSQRALQHGTSRRPHTGEL